ncbi:flagellar hook-length control protein FliK [Roseinatronobacter bogoriensis]|uniref:Flagellar hook-length control protein FliK n=2 Tax=Roseinatronobacter bogoriensis TaxID=119542 RepID=A0A2K8KI43_9RHOB|nr:flagellar hook-length control protein FliK [Rhodobaca bogoriensis]ATX65810.1 flagellar hook-length control protein FliK [Rhodobaca barguzinensis]TDW38870.1 flagellar hook-length control protein FliK [Rhodobaca barguzinensis]TDY68947.1 flagellar hook-length control protein FliK [Rhodobaca bogoriensis DSM 18756]
MSEKLAVKLFGSDTRPARPAGGRALPDESQSAFHEYLRARQRAQAMRDQARQNSAADARSSQQQRSQQGMKAEIRGDEAESDAHPSSEDDVVCQNDSAATVQRKGAHDPVARGQVSFLMGAAQIKGCEMPALNIRAHSAELAQDDLVDGGTDAGTDAAPAMSFQEMETGSTSGFENAELQAGGTVTEAGGLETSGEAIIAEAVGGGVNYSGISPSALRAEPEFGQAHAVAGSVAGVSNIGAMQGEVLAKGQRKFGEIPARRVQGEMALISEAAKAASAREKPHVALGAMTGHSNPGAVERVAFVARMLEAGVGSMTIVPNPAIGDAMAAGGSDMPAIIPVDSNSDDALRLAAHSAIGNVAPARVRNPVADRLGPVVWTQVVEGIRNSSARMLQIQLAPVELGRVRITMNPTDAGVQVIISAERVETLDLMRKFSADFEKALADIGYQQLDMTFSHQQGSDDETFEAANANSPEDSFETGPVEQLHYRLEENGMDIRI